MRIPRITIGISEKLPAKQRPQIKSTLQAFEVCRDLFGNELELRESCYALMLNSKCRVLGSIHVSTGSTNVTIVSPKYIAQGALLSNATQVIVCHNHPSGCAQPSAPDDIMTKRIKAALEVIEVQLIDHIIVSSRDYYSYASEGRL